MRIVFLQKSQKAVRAENYKEVETAARPALQTTGWPLRQQPDTYVSLGRRSVGWNLKWANEGFTSCL